MPVTTQRREIAQAVDRTIVRNIHAPHAARGFVRTQLLEWHLPGLLDTGELVGSEFAANALQHGTGLFIEVRLAISGGEFTVKVWDANGADLPVLTAADPMAESGRGLALIAALAQDWGFYRAESGGKVVWATLKGGE